MSSNNTVERVNYYEVPATKAMRAIPRFGRSNDFADVFSKDQSEVTDYAVGLVFIGAFLAAIFLVWWIVLLILKCLPGTGFLGGSRFTNASRGKRVRIAYFIFTVLWLTFTVLLVTKGITNLQDTVITLAKSNQDVSTVAQEADRIAASLQAVGLRSVSIRDTLVESLGNFCPNNPNLVNLVGVDIEGEAESAVTMLQVLADFVQNQLQTVQTGLAKIEQGTEDFDKAVQKIELHDWQALLILVPWIIVPSLLLVGVLMAYFGVSIRLYDCIQSWFLLPLLIIMTLCSIVLACLVSILAVGNADFCSGGAQQTPDASVYEILNVTGVSNNDLAYQAIRFYVSQCQTEDPFAFVAGYLAQIDQAEVSVGDLNATLSSVGVGLLEQICGGNIVEVASLTGVMLENLASLQVNAKDTLNLLRCDNLVPIYTSTVYSGTCTFSVKGVTWTFAAFLVVACMGMFLILFRSSFIGNEVEVEDARFKSSMGEPIDVYAEEELYPPKYLDASAPEETYSRSYTQEHEEAATIENPPADTTTYSHDSGGAPPTDLSYQYENGAAASESNYSYSYAHENSVDFQYAHAFDDDYRNSIEVSHVK